MSKAYDSDFSAASSIDESAVALQKHYGFSPANAQWEAYAQGRKGATMVLKVADGTDFGVLAANLTTAGYKKPTKDDGVWNGGVDLVAGLDPTLTPELQYVVLLKDQGLVVTSDDASYAASRGRGREGRRQEPRLDRQGRRPRRPARDVRRTRCCGRATSPARTWRCRRPTRSRRTRPTRWSSRPAGSRR